MKSTTENRCESIYIYIYIDNLIKRTNYIRDG